MERCIYVVDFAKMSDSLKKRLKRIAALEHDPHPLNRNEFGQRVLEIPFEWGSVIDAILKLPIAPWNNPGSISGEIDTDKGAMKMSNDPLDDLFNFNTNVDPNAKNHARPDHGKQICLLKRYWMKKTFKKGVILIADLMIVKPAPNGKHTVGDVVSIAWMISYKGPSGLADTYAKERASEFVRALLGMPEGAEAGGHSRKLQEDNQPGTGIAIMVDCDASSQFPNYTYSHMPTTQEAIAAQRAYVLSGGAPAAQAPLNPPVAPVEVAPPLAPAPSTQPVYAPPTAPVYAAPPAAPAPVAAGSPLAFLFGK